MHRVCFGKQSMQSCNISVESRLLTVQRRQTNTLGDFMSHLSYEQRVVNSSRGLDVNKLGHQDLVVGIWPDDFIETKEPRFPSIAEAQLALTLFRCFQEKYPHYSIHVLSPYGDQVKLLIH